MKKFNGLVYMLTNVENDMKYVGHTTNLKRRLAYHFTPSTYRFNRNPLYKDILKFGKDCFKLTILFEDCFAEARQRKIALLRLEKDFILAYDTIENGYNIELGNELTDEMKKNLSEKQKKYFETHISYWKGKHLSEQTKLKLSKALKGKRSWCKGLKMTEKQKEKMKGPRPQIAGKNNHFYGKHHTKESRDRISKARKGKLLGKQSPVARKVMNMDTKKIFDTIKEASAFYNIKSPFNISSVCSGRQKTCGGFCWQYKE